MLEYTNYRDIIISQS